MSIKLDGKYELIHNENTGTIKCLRYGKEWRDLTGDGMVLSMIYEIERLKEENEKLSKDSK